MPVSRPYNPNGKRIGEMMQADLAKIGVNAQVCRPTTGANIASAWPTAITLTGQYGWTGDNGDPDNFFFPARLPGRQARQQQRRQMVQQAEFDDLLVKARTVSDRGERTKLYKRMQEIEYDETPDLLLAHSTVFEVTRANVEGYQADRRSARISLKASG